MGSRKYVDGFAKVPPIGDRPVLPCQSCGVDVAATTRAVSATCPWCVTSVRPRGRRSFRLEQRKGGRVRK